MKNLFIIALVLICSGAFSQSIKYQGDTLLLTRVHNGDTLSVLGPTCYGEMGTCDIEIRTEYSLIQSKDDLIQLDFTAMGVKKGDLIELKIWTYPVDCITALSVFHGKEKLEIEFVQPE